MKYLVVGLALFGECLAQVSRTSGGLVLGTLGVTDLRSRNSNQQALFGTQRLNQRGLVYTRHVDDFAIDIYPRSAKGSPKPDRQASDRLPPTRRPGNVAAVVQSGQQQQQQQQQQGQQQQPQPQPQHQSQSPPRRQQSPQPAANAPTDLPSVPRIRTRPAGLSNLKGRLGNFLRPKKVNIGGKQQASQGSETGPANDLASASSSKTPKPSRSRWPPNPPQSPNTMLNRELDWLAKGKWTLGRQPFEGEPHGMTGQYAASTGLWRPETPPRPKSPESPWLSSGSASPLFEPVSPSKSPKSPSSPPIRMMLP